MRTHFDWADPLSVGMYDETGRWVSPNELRSLGLGELGSWLSKLLKRNKNTIAAIASVVPGGQLVSAIVGGGAAPQPAQIVGPPAPMPAQNSGGIDQKTMLLAGAGIAALVLLRK